MFFAWRDTLRPFMTAPAWESYQRFFDLHQVAAVVPTADLRASFPALVSGATADFNHFWFYGLVPALIARAAVALHLPLGAHAAFLLFHWMLASVALTVAWSCFGRRGLVAMALMLAVSPAIWYADKVHTEFFTICLTSAAVALTMRRCFLLSACVIAIVSTQNISFLAIAGVLLLLELHARGWRGHFGVGEVLVATITLVAMFLHPAYYFFRLGVLTPQFLAGGASVGANARTFYLWFLDPDLGLLTNWPTPIVAAVVLLLLGRNLPAPRSIARVTRAEFVVFVAAYVGVSLLAQSSTQNLNSAASPGLARYGLWYIALFFPIFLRLVERTTEQASSGLPSVERRTAARSTQWMRPAILVIFAIAAASYAATFFQPRIEEGGERWGAWRPSWSSVLLQRALPGLYDPPLEVFVERYGGLGEDPSAWTAKAIVGPDCRKLLMQDGPGRSILGGRGCAMSSDRLVAVLDARPASTPGLHYARLADTDVAQAVFKPVPGTWYPIRPDSEGIFALGDGWGGVEPWGAWTSGDRAALVFACGAAADGFRPQRLELAFRGFVVGHYDRVNFQASVAGRVLAHATFTSGDAPEQRLVIDVPADACRDGRLGVTIDIDAPASPRALGLSDDGRVLGMGLLGWSLR